MKDTRIKIHFIKTVFGTYPIVNIEGEKYAVDFFKKNVVSNVGSDIKDILYGDELKELKLDGKNEGNYILEGDMVLIHYLNDTEFDFNNLKIYEVENEY